MRWYNPLTWFAQSKRVSVKKMGNLVEKNQFATVILAEIKEEKKRVIAETKLITSTEWKKYGTGRNKGRKRLIYTLINVKPITHENMGDILYISKLLKKHNLSYMKDSLIKSLVIRCNFQDQPIKTKGETIDSRRTVIRNADAYREGEVYRTHNEVGYGKYIPKSIDFLFIPCTKKDGSKCWAKIYTGRVIKGAQFEYIFGDLSERLKHLHIRKSDVKQL